MWVTVIMVFLLLALGQGLGCGKKGKLLPRDKIEDEEEGVPVELRIYPPRETPAEAIGIGGVLQQMGEPAYIQSRDLTLTPTKKPTKPEPTPAPETTPAPENNEPSGSEENP